MNGIMLGLVEVAGYEINGLAFGGITVNTRKYTAGGELSILNINGIAIAGGYVKANRMNGISIALVNYAEELNGIQIGLVNIAKNNSS